MLVVEKTYDDIFDCGKAPVLFCVWDQDHYLHEEVFSAQDLILVRPDRRASPRPDKVNIPSSVPSADGPVEKKSFFREVTLSKDGERLSFYLVLGVQRRQLGLISLKALREVSGDTDLEPVRAFFAHEIQIRIACERKKILRPRMAVIVLDVTDFK